MSKFFHGWRRKLGVLTLLFGLMVMSGCDPVRTINQSVTIRVLDRESRSPISGATVQAKHVWAYPFSDAPADYIKWSKKAWEEHPWYESTSDSEGRIVIKIVSTAIDGTMGTTPPPQRTNLGIKYLLRITPLKRSMEELEIQLNLMATGKTDNFLVEIVEIGPAKYEQPWAVIRGVTTQIGVVTVVMALVFILAWVRSRGLAPIWTSEIRKIIWKLQCRQSTPHE